MDSIRDTYGKYLCELGEYNKDIVVLDADLASSTKSGMFAEKYPNRFYNCGIAEYAMFGMAAGLAIRGKIPFANTFSVFISTLGALPARQLMSYSGLNMKLIGGYGGMSDAFDGPSHHSLEDLAIMRAMSGVITLVASDNRLTRWALKTCVDHKGPMYLRLSRNEFPDIYTDDTQFELGKAQIVRDGQDATVIACGVMVSKALEAAAILEKEGISLRVVDMFTIKPIDAEMIERCAAETGAIVTAEEHNIIGGLGGAVAEVLAECNCKAAFGRVGLRDTHAESGAYEQLLKKYGLDAEAVARKVHEAIAKK